MVLDGQRSARQAREVVDAQLLGECGRLDHDGIDGERGTVDPLERPRPHDDVDRMLRLADVPHDLLEPHMGEWTRDVGIHLDRLRHPSSVALRRPLRQGSDSSCHTGAMTTPRIHDIEFSELLHLEPHGPGTYVGIAARYPWGGRLFGGQVVAQALRAAALTVEADRPAHSLHSYLIRPGTTDEPIRYEVERLRNGRSFTTRQVVARQSGGAILNLSVSFQVVEQQADVSTASLRRGCRRSTTRASPTTRGVDSSSARRPSSTTASWGIGSG